MCFDISSTKIKQLVKKNQAASFYRDFDYQPFYHANGFSYPTVSIIKIGEPKTIYSSTWGFVPDWGENNVSGFRRKYNTLNAKSETLFSSNMYKESALEKRCLIIADGFFEPHKSYDTSIPYYCYIPSNHFSDGRDLFVFAGIYNELNDALSCSIITTEANDFFAEIHNVKKRMPLVLDQKLKGEWLYEGLTENQITEIMNDGFTKKEFKAHSVSKILYHKKSNTNVPSILDQVSYNTLFD